MKIILGQKVGMTQIWDDKGRLVGATVIKAEPNLVLQRNGQRSLIGTPVKGKTAKPQRYLSDKIKSNEGIWIKEVTGLAEGVDQIDVAAFIAGDKVKITGVTKGKGFAGTIKRHGFSRGPVSHGSSNVRQPGSIGAQRPQRVPKGQKMAGRMGGEKLTVRGARILKVDPQQKLLVVAGPVPGPSRARVIVSELKNG